MQNFVCTAPRGAVLISFKFRCIVPTFWYLVMFCTCRTFWKGLKFVVNFPLQAYVWRASFRICDMTHSYVWHDSFLCVTWLIHICDTSFYSYVKYDSFTRMTCLCDMTHWYVWHDSFICVTCLFSYLWHDTFISETWLIHTCAMSHSHVWHDSDDATLRCVSSLTRVTWLIHMCDLPRSYGWHDTFIWVTCPNKEASRGGEGLPSWATGCQRPIGCLIVPYLYKSFSAKDPYN